MKKVWMAGFVAAGALALGVHGALAAAECCGAAPKAMSTAEKPAAKELQPQTICPVMGGKIDKNQYVDHEGKRIYVCCQGCLAAVKADPAAQIRKLAEKGQAPVAVKSLEAAKPCPAGNAGDKAACCGTCKAGEAVKACEANGKPCAEAKHRDACVTKAGAEAKPAEAPGQ